MNLKIEPKKITLIVDGKECKNAAKISVSGMTEDGHLKAFIEYPAASTKICKVVDIVEEEGFKNKYIVEQIGTLEAVR